VRLYEREGLEIPAHMEAAEMARKGKAAPRLPAPGDAEFEELEVELPSSWSEVIEFLEDRSENELASRLRSTFMKYEASQDA